MEDEKVGQFKRRMEERETSVGGIRRKKRKGTRQK